MKFDEGRLELGLALSLLQAALTLQRALLPTDIPPIQQATSPGGSNPVPAPPGVVLLAVGGLLIGLSMGNWKHPRTNLEAGDAVVLFDGRDLSEWRSRDGGPARWKVEGGHVEVVAGAGEITTIRAFGDCQLHVEWAAPDPPADAGQDRGNSGVFLMGRYEVQVLDSYGSATYPDGQAAAIYGQYPPLVNASRPPGAWQSFDIVFRRPRFDERGGLIAPARITVLHNGVLVHDAVILTGPSGHRRRPPYEAHADRLPITLQDHASPVRFRNIWLRSLEDKR